jgi:hypothetical protein
MKKQNKATFFAGAILEIMQLATRNRKSIPLIRLLRTKIVKTQWGRDLFS